jgi:hypothetical protein
MRKHLQLTKVMNNPIFWDITLCSPLKINRRFGGTDRRAFFLQPAFTLVSCSAYSSTLKMGAICSSEISFDFQRTYTALYATRQNSSLPRMWESQSLEWKYCVASCRWLVTPHHDRVCVSSSFCYSIFMFWQTEYKSLCWNTTEVEPRKDRS